MSSNTEWNHSKMVRKTTLFVFLVLLGLSNIHAAKIIYIYGTGTISDGDSAKAVGYKALFDSFGHTTTLISANQIFSTQLSQYDLIIIGAGTAGSGAYDWQGDTASISAIKKSGKGILGMGRGGGVFFGKIGLWSNYGQSAGTGGTSIKLLSNAGLILTSPNKITIPADSILTLYNGGVSLTALYLGYGVPADVVTFALFSGDLRYAPFSFEKNKYFYWGFNSSASALTTVGANVMQNVIAYVLISMGVTAVNESSNANVIPSEFKIEQNYPNPFNPSTNIRYQLPLNSFVTLKVYDVLGREVTTLVNEEKAPGTYEVTFTGETRRSESLPSGVYIYTITANNPSQSSGQSFVQSKKMMLLK